MIIVCFVFEVWGLRVRVDDSERVFLEHQK